MEYNNYFLLIPVVVPFIAGVLLMFKRFSKREHMLMYVAAVLAIDLLSVIWIVMQPQDSLTLSMFTISEGLHMYFHVDTISKIFALLIAFVWLMAGMAAFEYMGFFCFYLIVGGVLSALSFSGNLFTMYVSYELMTLTSMPLVLHSLSHEAIMAGLKYLFYSVAGAFMVLFGFFIFASEGNGLYFTAGGVLNNASQSGMTLLAVFLMIIGFGTKAGMFPMHGWLPTAHPVAPAPASAVLSGVITKAGVLGIIRSVYYIAGADMIRGTWVQYTWIALSLVTVFMGSMLAYRENVLKKRLAYSTVSQVSYILFGLSVLHPVAFVGALMHVIFHSLVKNTLFISAGAIIYKTGRTKVNELIGIGKEMPVVMWCFTLVSLTLVGIPPTSAFVSKWYLATGALAADIPVASWLGPVILLISALLTAGYLLTISIKGFLPGEDYDYQHLVKKEPTWMMLVPLVLMTALAVIFGIYPAGLIRLITDIASTVL
jgi:multicomponent Na+:H+ antiporter subunit D